LHVTGCGRSGTTLLVEMMRSSFRCEGPSVHEKSILEPPPENTSVYITKHPGELTFLRHLLVADSRLHGLQIYRDPRSVVCSVHSKAPSLYATNFASWRNEQTHGEFLKSHPRFLQVRYERLIAEPDDVQQEVMKFFPFLEQTGPFSSYQQRARPSAGAIQALNGLRSMDQGRLEPWRHHLSRVKEQLAGYPEMADWLIELGYEEDTSWSKSLQGVPTCRNQAWETRNVHFLKRIDRWQRRLRKLHRRLALLRVSSESVRRM
jgi:hypothetical protein